MRKAYLTCRKRQNPPPGIEVSNFSFLRFMLDYKYQNNLFQYKTSYIEALRETESDFRFVYFFLYTRYTCIKRNFAENFYFRKVNSSYICSILTLLCSRHSNDMTGQKNDIAGHVFFMPVCYRSDEGTNL